MKNGLITLCIISFVLMFSSNSFAYRIAKTPGTGESGQTWLFGYEEMQLTYKSMQDAAVFDEDRARIHGGFVECRQDDVENFTRIYAEIVDSISGTYKGGAQQVNMAGQQRFYAAEIAYGLKMLNVKKVTFAPYVAIGYWDWTKDQDNYPAEVKKEYTWVYVAVGANLAWKVYRDLIVSLDGAVEYPWKPQMKTDFGRQYDSATFQLAPRPGFRVEAPVSYALYKSKTSKMMIFWTPYYQRWKFGNSEEVNLSQRGIPVTSAHELKSQTDIRGFRAGIGFNY